jgi:carboxylesterase 2
MNETFSGVWLDRFLKQYPANDSVTARGAYDSQWTDRSKVGTWMWAQLWNTTRAASVYTYFWDHAPPGQNQGAHHESEINYVLNNLYDTDLPWESADYTIADKMNSYWVNFIKTGDPNGLDSNGNVLVEWAATNSSKVVQHVGDGWGNIPISPPAKVELFEQWFATLPYF